MPDGLPRQSTTARSDRPRQPRRITGKWWALLLALAVQLGFLAVLVFSVHWQNQKPVAVSAELYAPPVKTPVAEPAPPPVQPPQPPPPVPQPKPEPAPPPKPAPVVEKPDTRAADIALKAKQEEERKKRIEAEQKAREAKEADDKRKLEEKRLAEARERQLRETAALRAQAEREVQNRAEAEAQARAQQAAEASARSKAEADWIRRIQAKVKGNVIVPSELAGNPEAIFDVVQLPTGEIIEATLRKASGNRAYDEAVQRAILKSSPLPRPDRPDLFQRTLTLKFRPSD
ncbi:MAG: cell envelope integrity protein TolA [Casimicrobiaceae bacterium]